MAQTSRTWTPSRAGRRALAGVAAAAAAIAAAVAVAVAQTTPAETGDVSLSYEIVDGKRTPRLDGATAGDPARGRDILLSTAQGNCLQCHTHRDLDPSAAASSRPGPPLDDVAERLSEGEIRLWIVNPAALSDTPDKPAYYSLRDEAGAATRAEPVLTAQQIEDLVAFLMESR